MTVLVIDRNSSPVKDWSGVTSVVVREEVLTEEMQRDLVYANRTLKLTITSETPETRKAMSVLFTGA